MLIFDNVYDEYEYYLKTYIKEYGPHTVVAYQCGGFYEIYSINDGLVDMKFLADILGIEVSRRNKSILEVSRQNCAMMGWPLYVMDKFMQILLDHNYTVVLVNQLEDDKDDDTRTVLKGKDRIKRGITEIVSKGTYIEKLNPEQQMIGKYIMCIFIEKCVNSASITKDKKQDAFCFEDVYAFGVSIIEPSTGTSIFFEIPPCYKDPYASLDELYRIRLLYPPTEIILISSFSTHVDRSTINVEGLCNFLDIENKTCQLINKLNHLDNIYTKASYQNHILAKVFGHKTGLLSPIEYSGLHTVYYARISYVFLLDFIMRHNESLVFKLEKPICNAHVNNEETHVKKTLIMSYNSAKQLDLEGGLLHILNNASTLMGKRFFRYRLLNPTFDKYELEEAYSTNIFFLEEHRFENVRKELKKVYDLERLCRKLVMYKGSVNDFHQIYQSLATSLTIRDAILPFIKDKNISFLNDDIVWLKMYDMLIFLKERLNNTQNDAILLSLGIHTVFSPHILGSSQHTLSYMVEAKKKIDDIIDVLNERTKENVFKLERNDRDGYYISCTSKRWQEFKKKNPGFCFSLKDNSIFDLDRVTVKSQTNIEKISHPYIIELSKDIEKNKDIWQKEFQDILIGINKEIVDVYYRDMKNICHVISLLDFHSTCAYNAFQYRHYPPILSSKEMNTEKEKEKSFIQCKNLRHPLVENVQDHIPFIGNDIQLGKDPYPLGLLLYGLNASGKSTLMKSIALSIILAQAGMFVPAEDYEFSPYTHIFSRITQGDNINKGQSTFMIEMQELRNILNRANASSLVIGDELCCGTESASALGIVSAGLLTLARQNKCSFIFTSHLHDLTKVPEIQVLEKENILSICHLHVELDPITKKLVYDRKLRKGPGLSIYGIEVCKALDLPVTFIEMANHIRKNYLEKDTSVRQSHYNHKVIIDKCAICQEKAQEVHHILHQHTADKDGFIGNIHKNRCSNLINVCEKCHDAIHQNKIKIEEYRVTSEGIEPYIQKQNEISEHEDIHTLQTQIREKRYNEKKSWQKIASELHISLYKVRKIDEIK